MHEIPELIRVAAPVYVKFGLRNAPDVYPAGTHLDATTVALSRERVRRARLGMELLARSGYEPSTSELGAAGLAVPVPARAAADRPAAALEPRRLEDDPRGAAARLARGTRTAPGSPTQRPSASAWSRPGTASRGSFPHEIVALIGKDPEIAEGVRRRGLTFPQGEGLSSSA